MLDGLEAAEVKFSDLKVGTRFDAEMYLKEYIEIEHTLKQISHTELFREAETIRKGIFDIKADCYVEKGIPFVRISNLRNMITDDSDIIFIPESEHERNTETRLRRNDIILSKTGSPAASLVTFIECNTSQDTVAVKLKDDSDIKSHYLVAFLNTRYGLGQMQRWFTGNIQMHLNLTDCKNLLIPNLSSVFQFRIEQIFEASIHKKNESLNLYVEAERLLLKELGLKDWHPPEDLTYEYGMKDVFTFKRLDSEFFHPQYDWLESKLARAFPTERVGEWGKVLKGMSVEYTEADEGVPTIRSGDLVDIDDESKFLKASENQKMFLLERGDVLVSSIGFGSIGKVQVFDKPGTFAAVSEVTVIRQARVNPYYLFFFLRSPAGQLQINRYITGATGQLHLYPKDVEWISVPIIQADVEVQLESLFKQSRTIKKQAHNMLEIAKRGAEIAIEQNEAAALAWMEEQTRHIEAP